MSDRKVMPKEKRITAVGYITITGVATIKGQQNRHVHTVRLGFAGGVLKSGLNRMANDFKKMFEEHLRIDYPDYDWSLKMTSRVKLTECDTLIYGKDNDTTGN